MCPMSCDAVFHLSHVGSNSPFILLRDLWKNQQVQTGNIYRNLQCYKELMTSPNFDLFKVETSSKTRTNFISSFVWMNVTSNVEHKNELNMMQQFHIVVMGTADSSHEWLCEPTQSQWSCPSNNIDYYYYTTTNLLLTTSIWPLYMTIKYVTT